jgi:hypothetical protein
MNSCKQITTDCLSLETTHFTVLAAKADILWLMKNEKFENIFDVGAAYF